MACDAQFLPLALVFRQDAACPIFSLRSSMFRRFIAKSHHQPRTAAIFSQRGQIPALSRRLAVDSGRAPRLWPHSDWCRGFPREVLQRDRGRPESVRHQLPQPNGQISFPGLQRGRQRSVM